MDLPPIISDAALNLNPLVTGWDEEWNPRRLELEDGTALAGPPSEVRDRASELPQPSAEAVRATLDAFLTRHFRVPCPAGELVCGPRTLIMGILNVTPDSFSDGGQYHEKDKAVQRGMDLVEQGADIIDVGGESTRPGAEPVSAEEERRRVVPVIAELARRCRVPLSVDTCKAGVAAPALDAGAAIVNDVTALADPDMAPLVARTAAALVLMHMQGRPRTMQNNPTYTNVAREVAAALRRAMRAAAEAGVELQHIIVDPGIGFGKTLDHNTEILRRLPVLAGLGRPILVGPSRKSLIERALGLPLDRRLNASLALSVLSIAGRASIIRVHDVRQAVEAAAMTDAVLSGYRPAHGDTQPWHKS